MPRPYCFAFTCHIFFYIESNYMLQYKRKINTIVIEVTMVTIAKHDTTTDSWVNIFNGISLYKNMIMESYDRTI